MKTKKIYGISYGFGGVKNRVTNIRENNFKTKTEAKAYLKKKLKERREKKWLRNPRVIKI